MGFVLVDLSRGASEQLTTGTNLRTTSSWHDLYIFNENDHNLRNNITIKSSKNGCFLRNQAE